MIFHSFMYFYYTNVLWFYIFMSYKLLIYLLQTTNHHTMDSMQLKFLLFYIVITAGFFFISEIFFYLPMVFRFTLND